MSDLIFGATKNPADLHAAAKEMANWMDYLMRANPDLERMCRAEIRHDGTGIVGTEPRSFRQDYDALMEALKHSAPGEPVTNDAPKA